MDRAKVPQFGNWEGEEIPYTICFDNARKGKKSGQLYEYDHQGNIMADINGHKVSATASPKHERIPHRENGEMRRPTRSPLNPNAVGHKPATDVSYKLLDHVHAGSNKLESNAMKSSDTQRTSHNRQRSREEGDMRRFIYSPLHNETAGRRTSSGDNTPSRVSRHSAGSNRSVEPSPLHPHSHARVGGKGSGFSSPSWERKASSEGSHNLAPSTPGRSRLRSVTRGDDSPNHSPAIPKFGEWDESDPTSAEEYSHIFSRVREEKHSDTGKVPVIPTETAYTNSQKHYRNDSAKVCGCFPWRKR